MRESRPRSLSAASGRAVLGSAGISFDFPSTFTCPSVGLASGANACSRCVADRTAPSSKIAAAPCRPLPSSCRAGPPVRRQAQLCPSHAPPDIRHAEQPREGVVLRTPFASVRNDGNRDSGAAAEVLYVEACAPARQHRQQRHDQRFVQIVELGIARPSDRQRLETKQKSVQSHLSVLRIDAPLRTTSAASAGRRIPKCYLPRRYTLHYTAFRPQDESVL